MNLVNLPLFEATETANNSSTLLPSEQTMVLVLVALGVLFGCIVYVFKYGRRVTESVYFRDDLVEYASGVDYETLLSRLYDRASTSPLDIDDPPPPLFGPIAQLYDATIPYQYENELKRYEPPPERRYYEREEDWIADMDLYNQDKKEKREALPLCREWEKRERKRFDQRRKEIEKLAKEKAETKIPKTMDFVTLGGGWTFLVEFTTIIVIIFALIMLGFLGVLEGKEISTILAAIAGYVLGKATAKAAQPAAPTPAPAQPAAPTPAPAQPAAPTPAPAQPALQVVVPDKDPYQMAVKKNTTLDITIKTTPEDESISWDSPPEGDKDGTLVQIEPKKFRYTRGSKPSDEVILRFKLSLHPEVKTELKITK